MKLSKAIEGYNLAKLADGYSKGTITAHHSNLNLLTEYLNDPEVEAITTQDLKRWFVHLRTDYVPRRSNHHNTQPLTEAAIHCKWKAIRSFWNWAEQELGVPHVAKAIPAPKYENRVIPPFTKEEIDRLLKACEHSRSATTKERTQYVQKRRTRVRDRALVLLLLDTGIRVGELSRLTVGDVDLETGEVTIRTHARGKKTRGRVVFLGKAARRQLWRYLSSRENVQEDEPLFLTSDDRVPTIDTLKHLIGNLGKRAGVDAHPHKFRHTFAIEYLRNGGDVFTLQRLLGHSTMEMVTRYLEIVQADLKKAHQGASPADRWKL